MMIYDPVPQSAPIGQGDIFSAVPRVRVSLHAVMAIAPEGRPYETTWGDIIGAPHKRVTMAVPAEAVPAIVITQNCDALRDVCISLCEIVPLTQVLKDFERATSTNKRVNMLTQSARRHLKWFYLPPGEVVGFGERMAADFRSVIAVPRDELESHRRLRPGRLSLVAYDHFREHLAHFFRRYAYDEWYPLSKEEMDTYTQRHPDADRYPWQDEG